MPPDPSTPAATTAAGTGYRPGSPLLADLLIDAPDGTGTLSGHQSHRSGPAGEAIGPLLVSDRDLSRLARSAASTPTPATLDGAEAVAVQVINTTGAGGLVALAGRSPAGLRIVGVRSALRDLDDLAQNAARVIAAAQELAEGVEVYVEIPPLGRWQAAVELLEAAELRAQVRPPAAGLPLLAGQLSVLIEADLPFVLTPGPISVTGALALVDALIDDPDPEAAAGLLTAAEAQLTAQLDGWGEHRQARVRRRLAGIDCAEPDVTIARLQQCGLIAGS